MKTEAPKPKKEVPSFIEGLRERAIKAGDTLSGHYMACVCGMWSHVLSVPANYMEKDGIRLYEWFLTGFNASYDCVRMKKSTK